MNTKQRGDIAEQAAVLEALKRGWSVLRPIGDSLPYDLVFDVGGQLMYVYPVEVFISFGSEIHMVEADRRQRRPRSSAYRDAWHLIAPWAPQEEILVGTPVKIGEAASRVIPSQVPSYLVMGKV
jgi:PD-(D/E)XK endonuclease